MTNITRLPQLIDVSAEIHDCLVLALDELDAGDIDRERAQAVMRYLRPAMDLTRQAVEVLS